jgi:ABC-type transport system involved in cytochrome bd biosynthesis fused ATPase/permease subunit
MKISRNVSEIIRKHVTLEVESIDRMYLNVYQPHCSASLGWLVSFVIIAVSHSFPQC